MPGKTVIQTDQAREFMETMDPLSQRKYAAILQLLDERGSFAHHARRRSKGNRTSSPSGS